MSDSWQNVNNFKMKSSRKKKFFRFELVKVFFRTKASDKSRSRKVGQNFRIFVKKQLEQIKKNALLERIQYL